MGCPGDMNLYCEDDEKPVRQVKVDAFLLDEHEVTVSEYASCVEAGICGKPKEGGTYEMDNVAFNWGKPDRVNHPLNGVNSADAETYCAHLGKRLPTEAEMEWVLRGADLVKQLYPWGKELPPPANYGNYPDVTARREIPSILNTLDNYDDGWATTATVCSFTKNPLGLCDISGNVWEWCLDFYDPQWYEKMPENNPVNNEAPQFRVVRGSSWFSKPHKNARIYDRGWYGNDYRHFYVGFRCARDEK